MSARGSRRLVLLDDVPLDSRGAGGVHDRREWQVTLTGRRVVGLGARRPILHVQEADAVGEATISASGSRPPTAAQ